MKENLEYKQRQDLVKETSFA